VLGAEVLHLSLREVGVHLDLVDRRHHRRAFQERREVFDHEVADSDRADLAAIEQRLQGTVGFEGPAERRRQRLVQDQKVDLVDAELTGAFLEGVQRALINGRSASVRGRFEEASQATARISTSSVVTFELWYGVAQSARPEANADRLAAFLAGSIDVIDFDDDDAQAAR
jgi:hypothetical protein